MDAEVNAAVSEQQRPSEDSDRIPPFSEQPGGEQRDREADRRMGRYRAVQSAAVTPHGMDEGFDVGRMGRPEFRREVFEEIADLVGRSDAQAEHDRYPQQAAPAPLFPDRVQDRRIKRNPGQPGRNDVKKSIPARSAVPVEGQQQLLVDIQKGLPNHRCGSF